LYVQLPSSLLAVGSKFTADGSVQPSGTGTLTSWAALPALKIPTKIQTSQLAENTNSLTSVY